MPETWEQLCDPAYIPEEKKQWDRHLFLIEKYQKRLRVKAKRARIHMEKRHKVRIGGRSAPLQKRGARRTR